MLRILFQALTQSGSCNSHSTKASLNKQSNSAYQTCFPEKTGCAGSEGVRSEGGDVVIWSSPSMGLTPKMCRAGGGAHCALASVNSELPDTEGAFWEDMSPLGRRAGTSPR